MRLITIRFLMAVALMWAACLVPAGALAVDAARLELTIEQHDTLDDRFVLLYRDSLDLVKGVPATGFLTCLSIDLTLTNVDSAGVEIDVHAYTLADQPQNYAQRLIVEFGLPARLQEMIGKGGNAYRLTLTPLEAVSVDTMYCGFRTTEASDFRVDPSAHVNIHYAPNTLADHYWNSVRGILNQEYEVFKRRNKFNLPGRYELFLCPCEVWSVIWDKRFSMMADPIRRNLYAVYAEGYNSAYPFLMNHAAILRHHGYAPPFLSEGYANYQSFAIYDAKKLAAAGSLVPLQSLMATFDYLQHDPRVADPIAGTFVKYLVDHYSLERFLEAYKKADDLSLQATLEEVYCKPLATLEAEWLHYIDTTTLSFDQIRKFRDQAETMRHYDLAKEYSGELMRTARNRDDSLLAMGQLVRDCFFTGDYYGAIEWQREQLIKDSGDARYWMGLAAYEMMSGEYESAEQHLAKAADLDSASQFVMFNRGLNYLYLGDTAAAKQQWGYVVFNTQSSDAVLESQVLLGHLLRRSEDQEDRDKAMQFFGQVIDALGTNMPTSRSNSQRPLWLGVAYLGIEDTGNAYEALLVANFLDSRPFYRGLAQLWLGKVADVRGEPDVAREHYGNVIAGASAHYHAEEARAYLETRYQQ